MAYMMGIDVGTTGTRAVIVRPDGHVVGAATGDHQPMRMAKPGWAEQDPEDWWQATLVAIRAALEQSGVKGSDIAAVGFSGQMHGVVLLDKALAVHSPLPHLVRSAQPGAMRLDHPEGGGGAAHSICFQPCAHRL